MFSAARASEWERNPSLSHCEAGGPLAFAGVAPLWSTVPSRGLAG